MATREDRDGLQRLGLRWADIDGPVHYLDFGGPARGPIIVCVHGLGGSAVNWSALAPLLTDRYRVLAPDLAGHGLTRSGGRGTDVTANRHLLDRFIRSMSAGPVILMGNSMGGMISLLEATYSRDLVAGLILVDPALPFMPARPDLLVAATFALGGMPVIGRVVLGGVRSLPPEAAVAGMLALCCADPARVDPGVRAQHAEVARRRAQFTGAGADMAAATRSVIAVAGLGRGGLTYRQGIRTIDCPVLLLHGERDRLVPVSVARAAARANPSWSLVVLPGAGHVPQLEVPLECAAAITDWLSSAGSAAVESAASGRMRLGFAPARGRRERRPLGTRSGRAGRPR
ncbi:MAG: alpha/beta fold hydrolase [Streptosporangiaceae bacterium]